MNATLHFTLALKGLYLSLIILLSLCNYSFAQCPSQAGEIWKSKAEQEPTEKNLALAEYHNLLCPCMNGVPNPNYVKEELNALIEKFNTTINKGTPLVKIANCKGENLSKTENYIEWNGKKEIFDMVQYDGNVDSYFPKQLKLGHTDFTNKKFQYIRLSGFNVLEKDEEISICSSNENCLLHVGIIDQDNDYNYYQAKSATLKGIGNNMYELTADFYLVGMVGNDFQNLPNYPNYQLKAIFTYFPIFEMN
ncbi:MAG: hypothetical protein R2836_05840 [Chitinophagales bacterium]